MTETAPTLPTAESAETLRSYSPMKSVQLRLITHAQLGNDVYNSKNSQLNLTPENITALASNPTLPVADFTRASHAESAGAWTGVDLPQAYQEWSATISNQANSSPERQALLLNFLNIDSQKTQSISQTEIDQLYSQSIGDSSLMQNYQERIMEICHDENGQVSHEVFLRKKGEIAWLTRQLYGVKTTGIALVEGIESLIQINDPATKETFIKGLTAEDDQHPATINSPNQDEIEELDRLTNLLGIDYPEIAVTGESPVQAEASISDETLTTGTVEANLPVAAEVTPTPEVAFVVPDLPDEPNPPAATPSETPTTTKPESLPGSEEIAEPIITTPAPDHPAPVPTETEEERNKSLLDAILSKGTVALEKIEAMSDDATAWERKAAESTLHLADRIPAWVPIVRPFLKFQSNQALALLALSGKDGDGNLLPIKDRLTNAGSLAVQATVSQLNTAVDVIMFFPTLGVGSIAEAGAKEAATSIATKAMRLTETLAGPQAEETLIKIIPQLLKTATGQAAKTGAGENVSQISHIIETIISNPIVRKELIAQLQKNEQWLAFKAKLQTTPPTERDQQIKEKIAQLLTEKPAETT